MAEENDVWEALSHDINESTAPEEEKQKILLNIARLRDKKINIMITGATGCGKSSTINALFGCEKAKVGTTPNPETMEIERYDLDNLILWDSPGLGDGKEADRKHSKNIINKLLERDNDGDFLIDLVLVILDGGSRDLGTSYQLINEVIIPNLGEHPEKRILIGINQCDVAMKGRHWDYDKNEPDEELFKFLEEKAESVKRRIMEGTGVSVDPIFYSAGYKEEGGEQSKPYNLTKLLAYIIKATPKEKRIVYVNNINRDAEMWEHDEDLDSHRAMINQSFAETFKEEVSKGSEYWGDVGGAIFGDVGRAVGKVVGGIGGAVKGLFKGIGNLFSGW